jgi:hypothetical protein
MPQDAGAAYCTDAYCASADPIFKFLLFIAAITCEPVDWGLTFGAWAQGDFSVWDLIGLLPLLSSQTDDVGDVLGFARRAVSHGHHPIPKFLGGAVNQVLATVPESVHRDFHRLLRQNLRKAGLPLNVGGRGGSAADWARYFNANPGTQRIALDVVMNTSRAIDYKHGTQITHAVWQNVVDGSLQTFP